MWGSAPGIGPKQGPQDHNTRKMRTNINASSGIRTHGSSVLTVRYGVPVTNIFINPLKPKLV
jgi:hypothetical protein